MYPSSDKKWQCLSCTKLSEEVYDLLNFYLTKTSFQFSSVYFSTLYYQKSVRSALRIRWTRNKCCIQIQVCFRIIFESIFAFMSRAAEPRCSRWINFVFAQETIWVSHLVIINYIKCIWSIRGKIRIITDYARWWSGGCMILSNKR